MTRGVIPGFIGRMKMKASLVTLAVWFSAATLCFAASPHMGTWKLDEKKSKLARGTGKNVTVTYSSMLFQTKVIVDGVDGKGKPTHSEWTGGFDGKDHPVKGSDIEDTRAYRKIDDRTLEFTSKKGGKVMITGRVVVSADGKSRTVTTQGTTAEGKKVRSLAVYDKQ